MLDTEVSGNKTVEKLSKELNDSNDRSNNLRKMNEELLQMLESSMLNK